MPTESKCLLVLLWCHYIATRSVAVFVFGTHHHGGSDEYHCVTAKNVKREMHVTHRLNIGHTHTHTHTHTRLTALFPGLPV